MRKYKRLAILSVVLVALLVVFFSYKKQPPKEEDFLRFTDLCVCDSSDLKKVSITNNGINYVFKSDVNGTWGLVEPKLNIKKSVSNQVVEEAASIRYMTKIADSSEDLSQYGLDNGIKIKLNFKKDPTRKFILGDSLYDNNGYYFMEEGKPEIYSVPTIKGQVFNVDFSEMIETTLANFADEGLGRIVVSKNNKLIYDLYAVDNRSWEIVRPIKADVKTSLIEDTLSYNCIEVDSYVAYGSSKKILKKYGLNKPSYTIKVYGSSGEGITFDLGKETLDGYYYGRLKGDEYIFVIDPEKISFMDLTVDDLVLRFVDWRMIEDVKQFTIHIDGEENVFKVSHKKETTVSGEPVTRHYYSYEGNDITNLSDDNANAFASDIYMGFVLMPWDERDDQSTPKLKNPEITVKYITTDDKQHTIQYQKKNSVMYYVFKDGEYANVLTNIDNVEYALNARQNFLKEYNRRYK